jgi:hypothetical protein
MPARYSLSPIDLTELSDLAWTLADPTDVHEEEERLWIAALPRDWPPPAGLDQLRERLDQTVAALGPAVDVGRLQLVVAAMCLLAADPERRPLDEGLLRDAVREAYGPRLPEEAERALAERGTAVAAHIRGHGGREPRRHYHGRPDSDS